MITLWTRPKSFISEHVVRLPTASGVRAGSTAVVSIAPPCTVIDSKLRSRLVLATSELFYSIDFITDISLDKEVPVKVPVKVWK